MTATSLEVSKELYEVSGWKGTYFTHATFRNESSPEDQRQIVHRTIEDLDECMRLRNRSFIKDLKLVPAYDLGYLLRKLPGFVEVSTNPAQSIFSVRTIIPGEWVPGGFTVQMDTPEDAAAKLAIQLFKQGILKKENNNVN